MSSLAWLQKGPGLVAPFSVWMPFRESRPLRKETVSFVPRMMKEPMISPMFPEVAPNRTEVSQPLKAEPTASRRPALPRMSRATPRGTVRFDSPVGAFSNERLTVVASLPFTRKPYLGP